MLLPKRVKYRKQHRGRMTGKATRGNYVAYGDYGLQALEPSWITSAQIEAARIAMTRYIKRGGQVWIKIFPDKPVTTKALGTRMGSGKGTPEFWRQRRRRKRGNAPCGTQASHQMQVRKEGRGG